MVDREALRLLHRNRHVVFHVSELGELLDRLFEFVTDVAHMVAVDPVSFFSDDAVVESGSDLLLLNRPILRNTPFACNYTLSRIAHLVVPMPFLCIRAVMHDLRCVLLELSITR